MHINTDKQEHDELDAAEPAAREEQQRLLYRGVLDSGDGEQEETLNITSFSPALIKGNKFTRNSQNDRR